MAAAVSRRRKSLPRRRVGNSPQCWLVRRAVVCRSVVEYSCRHQRWPVAFVRQRRSSARSAKGAVPEDWRTQASPLVTREARWRLAFFWPRPASRRTEEETRPISADPSVGCPASVGVVMVGEAVGGVTVGKAGGAGEVGASASAGRIGVFIGDRLGCLAGILGGMALTGMPRGR